MAWDFETEPEFQEQLDWMREFIDSEIIPLEPVLDELPADEWKVVREHLRWQVKDRGLWGAFLDPELRDNPAVFLPPEIRAKCEVIEDLGADNARYTKAWDAIKAAK